MKVEAYNLARECNRKGVNIPEWLADLAIHGCVYETSDYAARTNGLSERTIAFSQLEKHRNAYALVKELVDVIP